MSRRRSTSRTPPIGGAPRGAHSVGAHKAAAEPEAARPTERRGRRRVAVVTAVVVVAAGIIALAVDLATGSSSPPTHGAQGASSSTTSQPVALNTVPPSIQTTPSTTTTIPPSTTTTTIPASTATTIATVPPSQILLDVLNGVGTPEVAAQAAAALKARGFLINEAGNAAAFDYRENVIQYRPGDLAAAETVAHYVSGASSLESSAAVGSGEVWLTLGSTYDGIVG